MYILENALISISRNKGRNLLIGIIIFVIAQVIAITLAINNSANKLINSYNTKNDIEATITFNRDNFMSNFDPSKKDESKNKMKDMFSSITNLSVDDVLNYKDSNYVKDYYYTLTLNAKTNLEAVSNNMFNDKRFNMGQENNFLLKAYSKTISMNEFINGTYTIMDGQVPLEFDSQECLINSELATLNNIKVNDKIKIDNDTYELTVIGIYKENDKNNTNMFTNSANTIITSTSFINKMQENNNSLTVSVNPTFILTNKNVIEKFSQELTEKGLSENLKVETNLEEIEKSTSAILNVKTFAVVFLIIALIIGTVILLIINMINIHERKYEIGVLRTIGMTKLTVSLQFISELLIVAVVSLLLGALSGSLISVPVSNKLLSNEIKSSEKNNSQISQNFGFKEINRFKPNIQAYQSIDATVDVKVLGELLLIGLLITLISGTSAMINIQKFSPLTILKERS